MNKIIKTICYIPRGCYMFFYHLFKDGFQETFHITVKKIDPDEILIYKLNLFFSKIRRIYLSRRLYYLRFFYFGSGLCRYKRTPQIIVNLTSYPARINTVDIVIKSLCSQSMKADAIILWLADSQFPNQEKDLPASLLKCLKYGVTIHWCKDIKSYKKLIPVLYEYPQEILVTADDDNVYEYHWLEYLYKSYLQYPDCIQSHRISKFYMQEDKAFKAVAGGHVYYSQPSFLNKLVGLGGVLYPPGCFCKDILREDLFMSLAPTNDDLWFWCMAVLNDVRIHVPEPHILGGNYIEGSQECALSNQNDGNAQLFYIQLNNLLNYYPKFRQKLENEFCKLASNNNVL